MLYIGFFFSVTLFVYFAIVLREERKEIVKKRMAAFLYDKKETDKEKPDEKRQGSLFKRIVFPFWVEVKRSFKRKMPGEKEAKIERKLLQAGSPFGMTPVEFRLFQMVLLILFPVALFFYGRLIGFGEGGGMVLGLAGILVALFLPQFYLNQKIKARNAMALRELPDILDLLTVSLEAGLGFDSAISKVVSKKNGVLADEFHRVLEEIRLGKTRREALTGIKERLVLDEISVLISSIVQAEKLGIGMVQVLRTQSVEVRQQRKQRAEEQAMKAPIKMLFPLVIFIFPSLFIVLLGPAVMQFIETFSK